VDDMAAAVVGERDRRPGDSDRHVPRKQLAILKDLCGAADHGGQIPPRRLATRPAARESKKCQPSQRQQRIGELHGAHFQKGATERGKNQLPTSATRRAGLLNSVPYAQNPSSWTDCEPDATPYTGRDRQKQAKFPSLTLTT